MVAITGEARMAVARMEVVKMEVVKMVVTRAVEEVETVRAITMQMSYYQHY